MNDRLTEMTNNMMDSTENWRLNKTNAKQAIGMLLRRKQFSQPALSASLSYDQARAFALANMAHFHVNLRRLFAL